MLIMNPIHPSRPRPDLLYYVRTIAHPMRQVCAEQNKPATAKATAFGRLQLGALVCSPVAEVLLYFNAN